MSKELINLALIYLIIYCGVSLLLFILQVVVKRKPVSNELDKYLKEVLSLLPVYVYKAEQSGLNGSEKLELALKMAIDFLQSKIQLSSNEVKQYSDYIKNQIELILSTPRKKVIK